MEEVMKSRRWTRESGGPILDTVPRRRTVTQPHVGKSAGLLQRGTLLQKKRYEKETSLLGASRGLATSFQSGESSRRMVTLAGISDNGETG
jgi:hypothetical protein